MVTLDIPYKQGERYAQERDRQDPLQGYRSQFYVPQRENGEKVLYFCGNSLGLQPKTARTYIEQELDDWAEFAVEGHFRAKRPWMPYHELLTEKMAGIVGGQTSEVVVMNALTVNLHLFMVSLYRPTAERFKIVIEANAFPSDYYAVQSQIHFHGFSAEEALVELKPREGESTLRTEDITAYLESEGRSVALVLLGGVNYYTGQAFAMEEITQVGHAQGCIVGFDLAHAAGNIELRLHEWGVDFAAWCTYKYLNAGPGGPSGCFLHERHGHNEKLPRFTGWWGHDKERRFLMEPEFRPIPGVEGWQISNPPIFSMAALNASLDIFKEVGMDRLCEKSRQLTGYLEFLIDQIASERIEVITPRDPQQRGCQLSIRLKNADKTVFERISQAGVIADWREPDVIRVAPVPLYNRFMDIYGFVSVLETVLSTDRVVE